MATLILPKKDGFQIDHRNGNTLDNRRSNLRYATITQQACNKKMHADNSTGFKGVSKCRNSFNARIHIGGKKNNLGTYKTAAEASAAYQKAAIELHGEFARLN